MTAVEPQAAGHLASRASARLGGLAVPDGGATRDRVTVRICAELEAAVHHLATAGARLADMFAADGGRR